MKTFWLNSRFSSGGSFLSVRSTSAIDGSRSSRSSSIITAIDKATEEMANWGEGHDSDSTLNIPSESPT